MMKNRDSSKLLNKQKILAAARALMQEGGLDALSMRALAERAQVSSRTPYNLFGSKTDVLLGLLDEPVEQLQQTLPQLEDSVLLMALAMLEQVYQVYAPQQEYYRHIYWGIMSSDHHATRVVAMERGKQLFVGLISQAIANGELRPVDAQALAEQLVTTIAGLLGLWAGGLIASGNQLLVHIRRSMGLCFLAYCSEPMRHKLEQSLPQLTSADPAEQNKSTKKSMPF